MIYKISLAALAAGVLLATGCMNKSQKQGAEVKEASADRTMTFIYGPINRSIRVADIKAFVEGAEPTGDLANVIKFGKLDPANVRKLLSSKKEMKFETANKLLTSSIGEAVLGKLGTVVHPRHTPQYGVQTIRAAAIAALADDDNVSILEFLENLPVDVAIEVEPLLAMKSEIQGLMDR
jgi:hypothetical protein